ncbi:hypothetical protein Taro_023791 [Colocasia esculenta]|uniref:Uncharacterized protein n=1 Tax=Colocasia esculenta TaxID=4460 RepID=A0A843VFJ0_COLES|nr:hypothetical protein [Colocasia esculenta]
MKRGLLPEPSSHSRASSSSSSNQPHYRDPMRLGNSADAAYDQMTQLMNPTPSEDSDATTNPPVLTPEEAFRQRLLEKQSQQKSEISQQKSEIERMKKIIEDQERRIAAQSIDIDVRVEAQVEARLAELKTQMLQSMDDRVLELIRIPMLGSGAPAVLPEDETDEEVGDGEDDGTFGEDE